MTTDKKEKPLTGRIKSLFRTGKATSNPHKRYPDEYYKNVYLTKKIHAGVEIIAMIEGISNKSAVNMLLTAAISQYMGELLQKHAENIRANRNRVEGTEPVATLSGIKLLRKYLAEHGMSEYRSKKGGL